MGLTAVRYRLIKPDGDDDDVHQGLPTVADTCEDELPLSLLLLSLDAPPPFLLFLPCAVEELSPEASDFTLSESSFPDSPALRLE